MGLNLKKTSISRWFWVEYGIIFCYPPGDFKAYQGFDGVNSPIYLNGIKTHQDPKYGHFYQVSLFPRLEDIPRFLTCRYIESFSMKHLFDFMGK